MKDTNKHSKKTPADSHKIREIEILDGAEETSGEETAPEKAAAENAAEIADETASENTAEATEDGAEDAAEEGTAAASDLSAEAAAGAGHAEPSALNDPTEEPADPPQEEEPPREPTREELLEEMLQQMVPASVAAALEKRAHAAESRLKEFAAAFDHYKAEHQAIRARLERDQQTRVQETLSRTFLEILGALDNLERSFEHADESPFSEGVHLIHKQFQEILKTEGLEKLELLGEPYDPELAEAVFASPVEDPEDANKVLEVFRPGYSLNGQVIRPAQVRVGKTV